MRFALVLAIGLTLTGCVKNHQSGGFKMKLIPLPGGFNLGEVDLQFRNEQTFLEELSNEEVSTGIDFGGESTDDRGLL